MTVAICLLTYFQGRAVLTEHEVVNLADECNLRMFELREDVSGHVRPANLTILAKCGRAVGRSQGRPASVAVVRKPLAAGLERRST